MGAGTAPPYRVSGEVAGRYRKWVAIFSRGKRITWSPMRQYRLLCPHSLPFKEYDEIKEIVA
jgi:hypothetical protein